MTHYAGLNCGGSLVTCVKYYRKEYRKPLGWYLPFRCTHFREFYSRMTTYYSSQYTFLECLLFQHPLGPDDVYRDNNAYNLVEEKYISIA